MDTTFDFSELLVHFLRPEPLVASIVLCDGTSPDITTKKQLYDVAHSRYIFPKTFKFHFPIFSISFCKFLPQSNDASYKKLLEQSSVIWISHKTCFIKQLKTLTFYVIAEKWPHLVYQRAKNHKSQRRKILYANLSLN